MRKNVSRRIKLVQIMIIDVNSIKNESRIGTNERIDFIGVQIDVLDMQQTIDLVEKYILSKTPLHLIGVNADKILEMKKNSLFSKIVNSCGVINADGASVVLASKFLGFKLPERVAGIDLMQRLIKLCEEKEYSIFLLGAKNNVVEQTAMVLNEQFPCLKIVGVNDGYFEEKDWSEISNILKSKKPDVVFVGISSPLKEYLVEYFQNDGNNCVFMGVGGSFDVISGNIKRAPKWMQKMCLEWLFRVIQEPRRLFKRYFTGNLKFLHMIIIEKINQKKGKH